MMAKRILGLTLILAMLMLSAEASFAADINFDGENRGASVKSLNDGIATPALSMPERIQIQAESSSRSLLLINMRTVSEGNLFTARDSTTGMTFSVQQRDYPDDEDSLHYEVTSSYMSGSYADEILQYRTPGQIFFNIKDSGLNLSMDNTGAGAYFAISGEYNEYNTPTRYVRIKCSPLSKLYSFNATGEGFNIQFNDRVISGTIDQERYSKRVISIIMGMILLARMES